MLSQRSHLDQEADAQRRWWCLPSGHARHHTRKIKEKKGVLAPHTEEMLDELDSEPKAEPTCEPCARKLPLHFHGKKGCNSPSFYIPQAWGWLCVSLSPSRHLGATGKAVMLEEPPLCHSGHQPCLRHPPRRPRHHLVNLGCSPGSLQGQEST